MAVFFGGARKPNTDTARDYQRRVAANARGVEREIGRLDQQEALLQRELAGCAKDSSRMETASAKAKEIVRLRAHRARLHTVKAHMTGLAQQLQTVQATGKIQETIAATGKMLHALNSRCDAAAMGRMLAEYERQNAQMMGKQELMDDALEAGFEADGEQEDCDEAIAGVLSEAGLDAQARMHKAVPGLTADDAELAGRLERLRTS